MESLSFYIGYESLASNDAGLFLLLKSLFVRKEWK